MNLPIANTSEVLAKAIDEILNPPKGAPLTWWPRFSKITGGLRPKEFSIFAGPTGAGKSLWLANLVAQLIDDNQKVFVAPVEIGEVDFTKMVLSVFAKQDFISGEEPTPEDKSKLMYALKNFQQKIEKNLVVTTYSGRVDVDEFIDLMKYVNDSHQANVAIADNLNFMLKPTRAGDQTLEMDETIHKFVEFVKVTPMHFFLVMHPRKTEEGKLVSEFEIKGSSTAVQEATNVLLMNRLTEKEQEAYGMTSFDREFVFKKLRKRGRFVNEKFYMRNTDANGRYEEITRAFKENVSGSTGLFGKKWTGPRKS